MKLNRIFVASALLFATLSAAQQPAQPLLLVGNGNRTLTATSNDSVYAEPDLAILHVGFSTQLEDAKSAYSEGSRASNAIVTALKQAGVPGSAIHSESQYLDRDWATKQRKFILRQQWTVEVSPERAAEILDAAINAGATSSGQIDWTVRDEKTLEAKALEKATTHARANAEALAKGMGVRLGSLIYMSNQISGPQRPVPMMASTAAPGSTPQPLSIEPHQVSREAAVYAVFAIE